MISPMPFMFQSTHPARGATGNLCLRCPVCDEVSIHAPREGCDGRLWYTIDVVEGFQSTHPARGATISMYGHGGMWIFQSTHPARGATTTPCMKYLLPRYFNPRTPRGVRPHKVCSPFDLVEFQSTHPARGATGWERIHRATGDISIHAPREGCDPLRRYDPQGER